MPERGPGIDFNSYESKITIGKVEKSVEQRITQTTEKIASSGIFDQSLPDSERNRQADEIVESFSHGFKTYIDIIRTIQGPDASVSEDQRNHAKEDYEVLSKSICLVMNSGRDQELQTRLNLGSEKVLEVLPKNCQVKEDSSDIVLAESVIDKSITNSEMRDVVRKLDKIRKRCDINNPNEKEVLRKQIEETVGKLILIDVDDKDEDQLMTTKSCLNTEAQILAGVGLEDRIEAPDIAAALGQAAEKISAAAEKMAETIGKKQQKTEIQSNDEDEDEEDPLLKSIKEVLRMRNNPDPREKKEMGDRSFGEVLKKLDEIEESGREATDLTINTQKFRFLYEVAIGNYKVKDLPEVRDEETGKFREMKPEELKEMILERIQLNDRFLLASKTKAIEDIVKTMSVIHEGDNDKSLDRNFVGFFLKKEAYGLLPIAEAWDLRQDAYFKYFDMDSYYRDEGKNLPDNYRQIHGSGMVVDIVNKHPELLLDKKIGVKDFLDVKMMMHESKKFGIYKDYYSNLRCEINTTRKEIVKEYMILEIIRKQKEKGKKCERKDAEKACDLAAKLSVATYQDSAANIGQIDADDYAELRLFKFLRYQDGVEADGNKNPKNKSIGSYDTISQIDTLTPTFLEAVNKNKSNEMWKPFYVKDINVDGIDSRSDMYYHFGSIILKKVLPAKALLSSEQPSKDVLNLSKLRANYERLNKTVSEALTSGMEVLDLDANDLKNEKGEGSKDKKEFLALKQRKLRFWYIAGLMDLASETRFSEWDTAEEILGLKELITGKNFYGPTQEKDQSFISEKQWEWIEKAYSITTIARNRERADARKKRAIFK